MSVPASLFIQPILQRTENVSSPMYKVLDVQTNFSTIDNILVSNTSNVSIFVYVYISNGLFNIIPRTEVKANSILELLQGSYFSLDTGEYLLASSDSSQNFFNINIEGKYFLEVSSAGVERPLVKITDFEKFAGREVKIRLKAAFNGNLTYKGQLLGVEEEKVRLKSKNIEISFDYGNIKNAKLVLTDDMFRALLNKK